MCKQTCRLKVILCVSESVLWRGYGYKNYSEDSLNQAVQACLEEKMTFRQAAKYYNVPSHTVYRRARKLRETKK